MPWANPDAALTIEDLQHVHIRQFVHWEEHLRLYIRNLYVLQSSVKHSLIVKITTLHYMVSFFPKKQFCFYSQRLKLNQVIKMTSMNVKQRIVGYISEKKPKTNIQQCNAMK